MTTADASPPEISGAREGADVMVGGYRVERLLRRHSATDALYVATDIDKGRSVELRVVSPAGDPGLRARFDSEVVLPASTAHPNLPAVYESGEAKQGLYLATTRLSGPTLADLAGGAGLSPLRAVRLLGGVADALDVLHGQGLAHGDVRLENVVVVEGHAEQPYLVDFALGGSQAEDMRGFVSCLEGCLSDAETPPAMRRLLEGARAGAPRSASDLIREAARTLVSVPSAPPAPAEPAARRWWQRRPRLPASAGARVPVLAAAAIVAAAAAAGFFLGRPDEGGEPAAAASSAGLSVTLPPGWRAVTPAPRLRGLDLRGPVAAAPPGPRPALVAGRLGGLRGSVYPAAVARSVDTSPPRPAPVSLSRYEALRFEGLDAGRDRVTLLVIPTSRGTLAAACLAGAPARCERSAASLELDGAEPSSIAASGRFAAGLERLLRGLERRRTALSRRLRAARTPAQQERAALALAGAYRAARRGLLDLATPPAAAAAGRRVTASLAAVAAGYARLARAARRRERAAFDRARRSIGRSEAGLASLLHRL